MPDLDQGGRIERRAVQVSAAGIGATYTPFIFFGPPPSLEFIWRGIDTYCCVKLESVVTPNSVRGRDMLDTILVAAGAGFFVIAVLYTLACDRM